MLAWRLEKVLKKEHLGILRKFLVILDNDGGDVTMPKYKTKALRTGTMYLISIFRKKTKKHPTKKHITKNVADLFTNEVYKHFTKDSLRIYVEK